MNYYKMCRENAGLTQEFSAARLNISTRTLSDYETGHTAVPEDIVEAMCEVYGTRFLALWHLKGGRLGRFLPDFSAPESLGDMMFSLLLAHDATQSAYEDIKAIYQDRRLEPDEVPRLREAVARARDASGNLTAIIAYLEQGVPELQNKRV